MSTAARSVAYPVRRKTTKPQPARRHQTQRLRLVVPSIAKRGIPFSTLCVLLLVTAIVGVLIANIYISHSTYRVDTLTEQNQELQAQRDRLAEDISYRQSPQNIKSRAQQLGLKYDAAPTFLMPDGSLVTSSEAIPENRDTKVPAPRADAREDVRPNLRSEDTLPAIGRPSGSDLEAPEVKEPN